MDKAPSTSIVRSFRVNFQKDPEVFSFLVANEASGGDFSSLVRALLLGHITEQAPEYLDHDRCKRVYLSKLESYVQTLKAEVESGGPVTSVMKRDQKKKQAQQAESPQVRERDKTALPGSRAEHPKAQRSEERAAGQSLTIEPPAARAASQTAIASVQPVANSPNVLVNTREPEDFQGTDLDEVGGYGSSFLANS